MWLLPSGFPEYSPAEQAVFDRVKAIIEKHYASFGYAHIHTPAVESNKVLLAKSGQETSKQIFGLYGLGNIHEREYKMKWSFDTLWENFNDNEVNWKRTAEHMKEKLIENLHDLEKWVIKDYSLHFDLTIPFARYILDHEGEITFPFKRYQIQPVWRGERAQRGRFREFFQCDIDSVWRADSKDQMYFYDAETLIVIANILEEIRKKYFPNKSITIHYNDRKFLSWLLDHYPNKSDIYLLFDKYYKIWQEKFDAELVNLVRETEAKNIKAKLANPEKNPELIEVENALTILNTNNLKLILDPFITRGLDYYTGMVYETFFDDDMGLGSISSWGRYENLTTYIDPKRNFSGVGGSIGISRLMSLIFEQGEWSKQTTTNYLCINFQETLADISKIAAQLRSQGQNVELYPSPDKLGKQFGYADKKWIENVVILGEWEKSQWIYKVKNMITGEEVELTL